MNRYEVNLKNEKEVIGLILNTPELIDDLFLSYADFTENRHAFIVQYMKEFQTQRIPCDLTSFYNLPKRELEGCGGFDYVSGLIANKCSVVNFPFLQEKIREFSIVTQANQVTYQYTSKEETSIETLREHIHALQELEARMVKNKKEWKDIVNAEHERLLQMDSARISGISTGYFKLNEYTDGWQPGDLYVIGARPSMGKTAFLLNTFLEGVKNDDIFLNFFSLEMSPEAVTRRLFGMTKQLNIGAMNHPTKIYAGKEDLLKRFRESRDYVAQLPMYVGEERTPNDIRAVVKQNQMMHKNKRHLIFVDYVQMMNGNTKEANRTLELQAVADEMKRIAKHLHVPVVLLSQLSRDIEKSADKTPQLNHLRDSGGIEAAADMIGFLHRDDYYENSEEAKVEMQFIVRKNRNGKLGTTLFNFTKPTNIMREQ